jgi:hypothetical protein
MRLRLACLGLLCIMLSVSPASAQVLYDNGPINGNYYAWTISSGIITGDTITLAKNSTVGGFDLGVWEFPGDTVLTVDWSITSEFDSGTLYGKGTALVTDTFISVNQFGYDIDKLSALIAGPNLNAGTYWLNLQNATTQLGDPVFWDANSGVGCKGDDGNGGGCPSEADCNVCFEKQTIPSESFEIVAASGTGQTPEPGSIVLLGSGVLAVVGRLRRKLL